MDLRFSRSYVVRGDKTGLGSRACPPTRPKLVGRRNVQNPSTYLTQNCGPVNSLNCSQNQAPGSGSGSGGGVTTPQEPTKVDPWSFLKKIRLTFHNQREKYDTFLVIMKDFKDKRIDAVGVIARVKVLFKGHDSLILEFNNFLPEGYKITSLDEEKAPPEKTKEFEKATSFMKKIKERFKSDEHVCQSFLNILNMHWKEHRDTSKLYSEVAILFKEHQDLLKEFNEFSTDAADVDLSKGPVDKGPSTSGASAGTRPKRGTKRPRGWEDFLH